MKPSAQLWLGDSLAVLPLLPADSVDAIVTDPPYGLSFMGRAWDYDVPKAELWREVLRVLKPGGHLLSFFGTRTYHRGTVAIEDAGFEIRDQIGWLYGTGFPKSGNLKPGWEPIALARKPMPGSREANVERWGTGELNIDGCRIAHLSEADRASATPQGKVTSNKRTGAQPDVGREGRVAVDRPDTSLGRWPANVIHDGSDEVQAEFAKYGESKSGVATLRNGGGEKIGYGNARSKDRRKPKPDAGYGDSGTVSRFFYCAKASKADRDEGLAAIPEKKWVQFQTANGTSGKASSISEGRNTAYRNPHPTVKPTDLMRYLCRLVTPPGGVVLDPFMGSGSTGKAAALEGFHFIGVDREAEYWRVAKARIEAAGAFTSLQSALWGAAA